MKPQTFLVLVMSFCTALFFAQETPSNLTKQPFSIGETIQFESRILNETRSLNIYLPPNFNKTKSYPVIYVLDGSKDEDFIHISGIVQFGSFSWIQMVPESIVVGISNIDRKRDFTYPSNNKQDIEEFPTSGGSQNFIQFLDKEVIPFIESNYTSSTQKTIIGQSLGGLLVTEIVLKKPDLFDKYIIVSPSLWWDDERLLSYDPITPKNKLSIYISVGKEGEIMERVAKALYEKLNTASTKNTTVYFNYFKDKSHGDALHLSVYDAFEKLFKSNK